MVQVFDHLALAGSPNPARPRVGPAPKRELCGDFRAELTEFNGERDHVHLLVRYPPQVALSKLVGSLKGVSARLLRKEYPDHIHKYLWGDHFWSPSYFAASAGGAPLQIVKEYIENQKRPG